MKKTLAVIFSGFMVLTACAAYAADIKVGVVDLTKVVTDSPEGKKANAELDSLVKTKQAAMAELGTKIEGLKKDIQTEKDAARKKTKEAEINKLSSEYQNLAATSQADIQKKANDLRATLLAEVKKAIDAVGSEDKFTLIFTTETVPYFQKTIEITDKVAKKFAEMKKTKK